MSDRLYLSCRLKGLQHNNLLRHFEKTLALFPFSKLAQRGPILRLYVLQRTEPPAIEREFELAAKSAEIATVAREFYQEDCAIEIDGSWDLWQFDAEWKLRPAAVTITCFGPDFENDSDDHIRIDLGLDRRFLPDESVEGSLRMGQSNLRSLVHFVTDVEKNLPLESRRLWSESGANFADLLAAAVGKYRAN